jgi:hypothetical protein
MSNGIIESVVNGAAASPKVEDETWTIRPDRDVRSLMSKAINQTLRLARQRGIKLEKRGLRTRLLNEAIRAQYASLRGKREENQ